MIKELSLAKETQNNTQTDSLPTFDLYIGGRFVESLSGKRFTTLNPVNNKPLALVAEGGPEDIDRAVEAASEAFEKGPWRRMSVQDRSRLLRKMGDLILAHGEELARWEALDVGKSFAFTMRMDVQRAAENFYAFAEVIPHLHTRAVARGSAVLNYILREPLGVVGLITPWNVPLIHCTMKLASALAAGNTCVLKPAEWAPIPAVKLAELFQEADFPPGVVNIVPGFGEAAAGEALTRHPKVRAISFTGETATGRAIMANASSNLKRVSFELGGKSANIIFADADLETAVRGSLVAGHGFAGQGCINGTRILVERSRYDEFVAAFVQASKSMPIGDPMDPKAMIGPLIHPEHWQRVDGFVQRASSQATMLCGGGRPEGRPEGNFYQPTVFADVTPKMEIYQNEVFGPVIVVLPFSDEAEVIERANDTQYGLAGYIWTNDLNRAHRVAAEMRTGTVWVNTFILRDLDVPFGGYNQSGMGRQSTTHSIDFFSEEKTVCLAIPPAS